MDKTGQLDVVAGSKQLYTHIYTVGELMLNTETESSIEAGPMSIFHIEYKESLTSRSRFTGCSMQAVIPSLMDAPNVGALFQLIMCMVDN